MPTVLSTRACPACAFDRAEVREGKRGAVSLYCPECGFQGLGRSPKASAALRASSGGAAPPAAKPGDKKGEAAKGDGLLGFLDQ